MAVTAKITSKGQITIPVEIRQEMGVGAGDRLAFERRKGVMSIVPVRTESRFERYRGIGVPGIGPGKEAVLKAIREMRGE